MRRSWPRLIGEAVAGVVVSAALAVGLIAPYWAGSATFTGLFASGTASPGMSVSGVVLNSVVIVVLLVLGTAAASILARSVRGLVLACGIVSLLVLLLLPLEWPWYATLPAAVLPLEAGFVDIAAIVVLTLGSRLVAPIGDAASLGVVGTDLFTGLQELIGQTIPAIVGLVLTVRRPIVERSRDRRRQVAEVQ
jgi:hypothetical protein